MKIVFFLSFLVGINESDASPFVYMYMHFYIDLTI
jgi:hypothetical protein